MKHSQNTQQNKKLAWSARWSDPLPLLNFRMTPEQTAILGTLAVITLL
jgi:hypothetical protein